MAKIERKEGEGAKSRSSDGSSVKRAGIPKAVFVPRCEAAKETAATLSSSILKVLAMSTVSLTGQPTSTRGGKGLVKAFTEADVDEFMQDPENSSAEAVLRRFDEQHNKYKFMEANLSQKKKRLRNQIPDIQKSLDMVDFLKSKQGSGEVTSMHYLLSEGVHAMAEIPSTDTVLLWLGANVMLEYPIDEAVQLLRKNLETARSSLHQVEEDLDFLKDQLTTIEVGMARVYNWDVKERRKKKGTAQ